MKPVLIVGSSIWALALIFGLWAGLAKAQVGFCVPGNTDRLSSDTCLCSGAASTECQGSCVSGLCTGATTIDPPICATPGNGFNLSSDGCPCNVNGDCAGNCVSGVCSGTGVFACTPLNVLFNTSPNGCPCNANGNCQGDCDPLTRTCEGLVAQVQDRQPTLSGLASADTDLGGAVIDTATLSNITPSNSTVTFSLYGPGNPLCIPAAAFTAQVAHNRDSVVVSPAFVPTAAGTYRFVARYSGNAWNRSATTSCSNTAQHVVVAAPLFKNGFE
jgi:hypothetical protein